ncbi:hypothetical protein GQ600_14480 [Phytophthora cactorum]|nr:hypothetical protein GQ600_14480 [Phytophthora cactorum]
MLKDVTKEDELELTTSLQRLARNVNSASIRFSSSRPEGEGIFSGMDSDETGWVSVRPYSDEVKCGTLIEACSRQDLVPFVTANAKTIRLSRHSRGFCRMHSKKTSVSLLNH